MTAKPRFTGLTNVRADSKGGVPKVAGYSLSELEAHFDLASMSTRLAQVEQRLAELPAQIKSDVDGQIEKIRALSNTWAWEFEQRVQESGAKTRNEIQQQIDKIRAACTTLAWESEKRETRTNKGMDDKIDVIRNDIDVMRATAAAGGWERQKRDAAWDMELDSRIAQSVKRMESRVTKGMKETREMAGWLLFFILIVAIAIGNSV